MSPGPLTNRLVWNNLLPKLEELITAERDRRTKAAYRTRVDERLGQIVQRFEAFFSDPIFVTDLPLFPTPRDVRDLPSVRELAQKDDAEGDIYEDDFLAITDQVLIDIDAYKLAAKHFAIRELPRCYVNVEVIKDDGDDDDDDDDEGGSGGDSDGVDSDNGGVDELPFSEDDDEQDNVDVDTSSNAETASAGNSDPEATDQDQDPDVILNKFFAYFRCAQPDREYGGASCMTWDELLPFADIHAHFREAHPQCSWFRLEGRFSSSPSAIHRPYAITDVGRGILGAVGISCDTPQSALDEYVRSGRLYCACGDPTMPPPEKLDWIKLVRISYHLPLHVKLNLRAS